MNVMDIYSARKDLMSLIAVLRITLNVNASGKEIVTAYQIIFLETIASKLAAASIKHQQCKMALFIAPMKEE